MPPKALLLDLDDTLIDTREGTRLALRDFHGTHGHLMIGGLADSEAAWDRGIKLHFPRYVRGEISFQEQRRGRIREIFARPDMPEAEADRLFRIYLDHYAGHYLLFDDVVGFLEGLSGTPVAIVTNGSVEHQTLKLKITGLDQRVPVIVISEGVGLRKPQKEIFEYAARALGVAPGDCLMVGDNYEVDCLGAQSAGMQAAWINRFGSDFIPDGGTGIGAISSLRSLVLHQAG
jgi:putative hydrolase of the HAD superfamily